MYIIHSMPIVRLVPRTHAWAPVTSCMLHCARYSPHTRAGTPAVRHAARIPTPRMVAMQVDVRRARLGSRARPRKHSYPCYSFSLLGRDLLICSTVLVFLSDRCILFEQKQFCLTADLGNLDVLFEVRFVQQNVSRNS